MRKPLKAGADGVVRLSGGNPQIAKGDGDAPVQAYIKAMPGWQSAIGKQMDVIIEAAVPKVAKAVKWNSPFYGKGDGTWFVSFHVYAKYIKVTFFRGAGLKPAPVEPSKVKGTRYLHVREGAFDEAQFASWVKQAAKLPGEKL
ncbi:MAG TPA: DUF1801 domain-containing protein [Hyphomonadaceae bacterium]|nr:DUF1801 domain-containing protein [Hyphomonadaceae bacterium]HPN05810.1 DUF1801 domain-containing protein [Hyphomonadaceae bacterium]